jgi:peptidoglycan/xylan/chitin deacetylase (PgdA/CDA1 family)
MSAKRNTALVGGLVAALVAVPGTAGASTALHPRSGTYSGPVTIGTDHSAGRDSVTVGGGAINRVLVTADRQLLDAAHSSPGCALLGTRADTAGYARAGSVSRHGSFSYAFSKHTVASDGSVIDDVIRVAGAFSSPTHLSGRLTRTVTTVTPAPAPASPDEPAGAATTQTCAAVPVGLHATHPAGVMWPFPKGPRAVDCSKLKCVALTFDDGPGSETPQLLRMLRARHARATFFVLGQVVAANPGRLRMIDAAGHEIGNHSWSHALMTSLSSAGVRSQFTRTDAIIRRTIGYRPTLVRPPYGGINARVDGILRSEGHPAVLWDVDPLDWKDRNSSIVESRVLSHVRPGSIVLMHDIHPTTVAAVPAILAELARRGYTFVTVSELYGHPLRPGANYYGR